MHAILNLAAIEAFTAEWVALEIVALQLIAIFFLVFLNGFFVASEFAIVKVRGSQLDALVSQGRKGAALARHVTSHLDSHLSATQLGITLASLALGWLGEPFLAHMLYPFFVLAGITSEAVITTISFTLAFAAITFLHIVLGELAPKSLAIRKPLPTTLWISRPLTLFHSAFKPAIWFLNGAANIILKRAFGIDPVGETELVHSEEELRLLLAESGKAREISSRGSAISMRALELTRLVARDVMTPRPEVVFLEVDLPFAENLARAKKSGHTRFPLCRKHLDDAFGLIHVKDMICLLDEPQPDLNALKRELLSVPEMISLEKLLDLFQSRHAHLALVLDEYGGAVGIVTLDNVIEELVGDIQDEFDTDEPPIQRISADEFTIKGRLSLHEVGELTGLELESSEVSTLGGYVTSLLGHLPQPGDSVRIGEYIVTVINTDGHRVRRLRFEKRRSEND